MFKTQDSLEQEIKEEMKKKGMKDTSLVNPTQSTNLSLTKVRSNPWADTSGSYSAVSQG